MPTLISLSIAYTPWTIDTYNTFNFDSHDEQEIENYNDEYGTAYTYGDFEWTYDHKGLVKQLADNWQELVTPRIIDDVILAVTPDGEPWSPREYNFTTDDQNIIVQVNHDLLMQYITAHQAHYNENRIKSVDGFMWLGDDDQAMLHYYLHHKSASEDYTEYDYLSDQYDLLQGNGQLYEYVQFEPVTK